MVRLSESNRRFSLGVPALGIDLSAREVVRQVGRLAKALPTDPGLVLIAGDRELEAILLFFAARRAGHSVIWTGPLTATRWRTVLARWQPDVAWSNRPMAPEVHYDVTATAGFPILHLRRPGFVWPLAAEGHLLLPTSGSTGTSKTVALSWPAVGRAAVATAEAVGLGEEDCGATSLPLHHILGLSVLMTHAEVARRLILTPNSPTGAKFWRELTDEPVSSVTLLPHQLEPLLYGRGRQWIDKASLRTIAISGGRIDPEVVAHAREVGFRSGVSLLPMYGQTEACGRITVLPESSACDHPRSVGVAIPGTEVLVQPNEDGTGQGGQVLVRSGSLMSGYVGRRRDMAALGGPLGEITTGDLGYLSEGHLYLVGRRSRIAKPYGTRVELDEVEEVARHLVGPGADIAAVAAEDDGIHVFVTRKPRNSLDPVPDLAAHFALPRDCFILHRARKLPALPSGKVNYAKLSGMSAAKTAGEDG